MLSISALITSKLIRFIKTPFALKRSFDPAYLIIKDPSSPNAKNITPSCFNFEFVKTYFRKVRENISIISFNLYEQITKKEERLKNSEIQSFINSYFESAEGERIYWKIFGLKEFKDCKAD